MDFMSHHAIVSENSGGFEFFIYFNFLYTLRIFLYTCKNYFISCNS